VKSSTLIPCLQVSPLDADQAIGLAAIIAEFQCHSLEWVYGAVPDPAGRRPFWVCYRRDVDIAKVKEIEQLLAQEFDVLTFPGRNFAEGHPAGCNALWTSAMVESMHRTREGWTDHQAILTFEADCVPLRPDWIYVLELEWSRLRPAVVVGHKDESHINGNAMFSATLIKDHPMLLQTCLSGGNWDWANRDFFMAKGAGTDKMHQLYQCQTISEDDFLRIVKNSGRPAFLHGVKDLSAQKWARKHLFPKNLAFAAGAG
jgi:hypothetical protein